MARTEAFDDNADRYDHWFVRHDGTYISELSAVRSMLPGRGIGLEIGVGTARFAAPLNVRYGLDPSLNVLRKAHERRVQAVCGVAEALPFADESFDFCLIVTTICFVDGLDASLREARRILKPSGELVAGFVDRDSPIGQYYLANKSQNVFYRDASFYSARDVEALLLGSGFDDLRWAQTLFKEASQSSVIEPTRPGYGEGSFVVVNATRRTRAKMVGSARFAISLPKSEPS
jgi:SAM-dependent methyltransferase